MKIQYSKKIKLILISVLLGLNMASFAEPRKFSLIDINGIEQAMSDYIGQQKWVLVNVWSPTCSFCVQELPKIGEFKKSNPEISVIAVTLDYPSFEYGRIEIICVDTDNFKCLLVTWIGPKNISVEDGESKVAGQKEDYIMPDQLENRLFPSTE